jgi:hypothetical protein
MNWNGVTTSTDQYWNQPKILKIKYIAKEERENFEAGVMDE